jgi:hypothetical protein
MKVTSWTQQVVAVCLNALMAVSMGIVHSLIHAAVMQVGEV